MHRWGPCLLGPPPLCMQIRPRTVVFRLGFFQGLAECEPVWDHYNWGKMSSLMATEAIQTITIWLNCLAFCQKLKRPGDCIHLMRTSACQVSSVQGNAYLDDKKLTAIFFLGSRQNLGDLSSTENECLICPLTIRGCVRRKPSICICSCAHPFAKKNRHISSRENESPICPWQCIVAWERILFLCLWLCWTFGQQEKWATLIKR